MARGDVESRLLLNATQVGGVLDGVMNRIRSFVSSAQGELNKLAGPQTRAPTTRAVNQDEAQRKAETHELKMQQGLIRRQTLQERLNQLVEAGVAASLGAEERLSQSLLKRQLIELRISEIKERQERRRQSQEDRTTQLLQRGAQAAVKSLDDLIRKQEQVKESGERSFRVNALQGFRADLQDINVAFRNGLDSYTATEQRLAQLQDQMKRFMQTTELTAQQQRQLNAALRAVQVTTQNVARARARDSETAQVERIRQAVAQFRNYELALSRGGIEYDQFVAKGRELLQQLERERSQVAENTTAYSRYTNAMTTVSNSVNRAANSMSTRVGGLADAIDRLQQAVAIVVAGSLLNQFVRGLDQAARNSFQARVGLELYRAELQAAGRDVDEGVAQIEKLARVFNTSSEILARPATLLVRAGFSAQQITPLLEAVGASALSAGRDVGEAFDTFGDAVARRDSTLLNSIGIVANFDDMLMKMAKSLGVSKDALTAEQQATAITNGILGETRQEVAALSRLLAGYAGASSRLQNSFYQLGLVIGGVAESILGPLKETLSGLIDIFLQLPTPVQKIAVGFGLLATTATVLGIALATLYNLILNQQVAGPIIAFLLQKEIILRTRLGAVLFANAAATNSLTAAQLANAAAVTKQGVTTSLTTLALYGFQKAALLAGRALLGLLSNPVILGLTALGVVAVVAANNMEIIAPAMEAINTAGGELFNALNPIGKLFGDLGISGSGLASMIGGILVNVVTLLALVAVGAAGALRIMAAVLELNYNVIRRPTQAFGIFRDRLVEIRDESQQASNKILDAAQAASDAAKEAETLGQAMGFAAGQTGALSAEQADLRDELNKRFADVNFKINNGDVAQSIQEVKGEFDSLIADLEKAIADATLPEALRAKYQQMLEITRTYRRQAGIAEELRQIYQARSDATDAEIAAMKEGAARVNAQYDKESDDLDAAFVERTKGLKTNSTLYRELFDSLSREQAALEVRRQNELRVIGEQTVQDALELSRELEDLRASIESRRATVSGDAVAQVATGGAEARRELIRQRDDLLAELDTTTQQGRRQQQQINDDYDRLLLLNTQETNQKIAQIYRERQQTIQDIQAETLALETQNRAAQLRSSGSTGDEIRALRLEGQQRIQEIEASLERELQAEGVTAAQEVALRARAAQQILNITAETSRQVVDIRKQEQEQLKQTLEQGQGTLEGLQVDLIQGSVPQMRARFANEQQERKRQLDELLRQYEGNAQAQAQLRAQYDQIETYSQEKHLRDLRDAEVQGLEQYRDAVISFETQALQARQTAQRQSLENRKAALAAEQSLIEANLTEIARLYESGELDAGPAIASQTAAYSQLHTALERQVDLAGQAVQMAIRQRAESEALVKQLGNEARVQTISAADLTQLKQAQAAAQQNVLASLSGEADALRKIREEQLGIIRSGGGVLEFLQSINSLTGETFDRGAVESALNSQLDALQRVYRQSVANNEPFENQRQLLEDMNGLIQKASEEGINLTVDPEFASFLAGQGAEKLANLPQDLAEAEAAVADVDATLANVILKLELAVVELNRLLTEAAENSLDIRAKPIIDTEGLDAAKEQLEKVFGPETAKKIVDTFGDELKLKDEVDKAAQKLTTVSLSSGFSLAGAQGAQQLTSSAQKGIEEGKSPVINSARSMGQNAGTGLIDAFANGITGRQGVLLNAVRGVLQRVRNMMPSSDAKEGPLSDITWSGGKTLTTFGEGMLRGRPALSAMAAQAWAVARPNVGIPSEMMLPGRPGAGLGGAEGASTVININDKREMVTPGLQRSAREIQREARFQLKQMGVAP